MDNVRQFNPRDSADEHAPRQPHDIEAEQIVLGACMADHKAIAPAAALLHPGDFYRPIHETIWRALLHLDALGHPTDAPAVRIELERRGELARIGGEVYLYSLTAYPVTAAMGEWYADRVRDLAELRREIAFGTRLIQNATSPDPDRAFAASVMTEYLEGRRDRLTAVRTTWAPLDLTDVVHGGEISPPPAFLARDDGQRLFYAGKIHSVSGESESGKTWLCLLGVAQAIGAGHACLYLDFEDSAEGIVGRLRAFGLSPELILQGLIYVRPDTAIDDDARAVLGQVITDRQPGLCIVDGVTEAMTLHGWDPLNNKDAASFFTAVPRWVARQGPAVAMIDHVVKDAEKRGRYAMGAQHKLAGIDGAAYLVEPIKPFGRGQHGISRVRVAKDRPSRVREHAVGSVIGDLQMRSMDGDAVHIELRAPRPYVGDLEASNVPFRPTAVMEKLSRIIEANPGLSKNALETLAKGKREIVRIALELLIAEEFVAVDPGPNRSRVHRVVKPFREAADTAEMALPGVAHAG